MPHEFIPEHSLPDNESDSEDDSPIFDVINENAFEELCRLVDENGSPLPGICEKKKQLFESTFRFQEAEPSFSSNEPGHDQYQSFDEVLKSEKKLGSMYSTIQHKSSKARDLPAAPFSLSTSDAGE